MGDFFKVTIGLAHLPGMSIKAYLEINALENSGDPDQNAHQVAKISRDETMDALRFLVERELHVHTLLGCPNIYSALDRNISQVYFGVLIKHPVSSPEQLSV